MPNYVKPFVSLIDGTLLNLPAADGATGQVIQTDGAGALSFVSVLKDVVDDTTPQLGGNLDVNGFNVGGVTPAELGYVSGVTSDIQAQIDGTLDPAGECGRPGYRRAPPAGALR